VFREASIYNSEPDEIEQLPPGFGQYRVCVFCVNRALLISFAASAVAAFGQVDSKDLVDQSIRNYERGWRTAMSWPSTETSAPFLRTA